MYVKKKILILIDFLYIYIPIVIWLFGWYKWYITILCCGLLTIVSVSVKKQLSCINEMVFIDRYAVLLFIILFIPVAGAVEGNLYDVVYFREPQL